jgi:large subunit ribosomal protein L36
MKVRSSLKSLKQKPGSKVVRRRGHVYVINKLYPQRAPLAQLAEQRLLIRWF